MAAGEMTSPSQFAVMECPGKGGEEGESRQVQKGDDGVETMALKDAAAEPADRRSSRAGPSSKPARLTRLPVASGRASLTEILLSLPIRGSVPFSHLCYQGFIIGA